MWLILVTVAVASLVYFKIIKVNQYWSEKGVSYVKPWPVLGNMASNFLQRRPFVYMLQDLYNCYPDKRYFGIHRFQRPTLVLRDLELIKMVTTKETGVFPDHRLLGSDTTDPLVNKNLLCITAAQGWHDLRTTLSPAFTSSKMRTMFKLMEDCSEQLVNDLEKQGGTVTVNLIDTFTRFANDVIGTVAFGVSCNSFKDPENQFYVMGKDLSNFSGLRSLKLLAFSVIPTLMKLLSFRVFSKVATKFFDDIVKETLRVREENHIIRPDMIHLLMEARKGRLKYERESGDKSEFAAVDEALPVKTGKKPKVDLTDDDITAQAVIFFFGAFSTPAGELSHLMNELTLNPDIQEKLREEIDLALVNNNEEVTYELLLGMKFLDCVVSETLRKWPPFAYTDRISVQPFTINPVEPGEKPLHLPVDSELWIPIYPIHRDPNHYPNPDKFDPERFNDENKRNIKPYTYLPFGTGPRNCIGSRFALLEMKLMVVKLLRKFEVVPVKETKIPLVLSNSNIVPVPDDGIWVGLKPRTNVL